jgi:hypothetical protein
MMIAGKMRGRDKAKVRDAPELADTRASVAGAKIQEKCEGTMRVSARSTKIRQISLPATDEATDEGQARRQYQKDRKRVEVEKLII